MTERGKQVWREMERIGWENAPEGFHLEYFEDIIKATKQALLIDGVVVPKGTLCDCEIRCDVLSDQGERVYVCKGLPE
jgi:hypothetical protein